MLDTYGLASVGPEPYTVYLRRIERFYAVGFVFHHAVYFGYNQLATVEITLI